MLCPVCCNTGVSGISYVFQYWYEWWVVCPVCFNTGVRDEWCVLCASILLLVYEWCFLWVPILVWVISGASCVFQWWCEWWITNEWYVLFVLVLVGVMSGVSCVFQYRYEWWLVSPVCFNTLISLSSCGVIPVEITVPTPVQCQVRTQICSSQLSSVSSP